MDAYFKTGSEKDKAKIVQWFVDNTSNEQKVKAAAKYLDLKVADGLKNGGPNRFLPFGGLVGGLIGGIFYGVNSFLYNFGTGLNNFAYYHGLPQLPVPGNYYSAWDGWSWGYNYAPGNYCSFTDYYNTLYKSEDDDSFFTDEDGNNPFDDPFFQDNHNQNNQNNNGPAPFDPYSDPYENDPFSDPFFHQFD